MIGGVDVRISSMSRNREVWIDPASEGERVKTFSVAGSHFRALLWNARMMQGIRAHSGGTRTLTLASIKGSRLNWIPSRVSFWILRIRSGVLSHGEIR